MFSTKKNARPLLQSPDPAKLDKVDAQMDSRETLYPSY